MRRRSRRRAEEHHRLSTPCEHFSTFKQPDDIPGIVSTSFVSALQVFFLVFLIPFCFLSDCFLKANRAMMLSSYREFITPFPFLAVILYTYVKLLDT